jgi:hypothetical protein
VKDFFGLIEVDPIVWTKSGPSLATLCRASGSTDSLSPCFQSTRFDNFKAPGETEVGSAGEHPTEG